MGNMNSPIAHTYPFLLDEPFEVAHQRNVVTDQEDILLLGVILVNMTTSMDQHQGLATAWRALDDLVPGLQTPGQPCLCFVKRLNLSLEPGLSCALAKRQFDLGLVPDQGTEFLDLFWRDPAIPEWKGA